jgi:ParB/RepB/Spo0J family partition protein
MQEQEIESIVVVKNPRKDYGDLEELARSIKEVGVLEPILVNTKGELIAGERRLRAAKMAGLQKVPVRVIDLTKDETEAVKLVENVQRKDLNPFEEGEAYAAFLKDKKHGSDWLEQKLGKKKGYVQRRVNLTRLGEDGRKALLAGKLQLGHASILSQLNPDEQKKVLKTVLEHELSIQELRDALAFTDLDFEGLPARLRKDTYAQTTLFSDLGKELKVDDKDLHDVLKARIAKYVEEQRAKLRAKNVRVYAKPGDLLKANPESVKLSEYDYGSKFPVPYHEAVKKLPGSQDYAVVLYYDHWIKTDVYCTNPASVKKTAQEQQARKEGKKPSQKDEEATEKLLEQNREDRLKTRVAEYRLDVLRKLAPKHHYDSETLSKAVTAFLAWKGAYGLDTDVQERLRKEGVGVSIPQYGGTPSLANFLKAGKELDKVLLAINQKAVEILPPDDLESFHASAKTDLSQEWTVDEEFLELHTKDQLGSLARELNISLEDASKKDAIIKAIIKAKPKGKVPKVLARKTTR